VYVWRSTCTSLDSLLLFAGEPKKTVSSCVVFAKRFLDPGTGPQWLRTLLLLFFLLLLGTCCCYYQIFNSLKPFNNSLGYREEIISICFLHSCDCVPSDATTVDATTGIICSQHYSRLHVAQRK